DRFRDTRKELDRDQKDVARLQNECGLVFAELPEAQRRRVSPADVPGDWLATTYPSQAEVDAVRAEAGGLSAARPQPHQAEQVRQQWDRLRSQEALARQTVDRLRGEVPGDRQKLRAEHSQLRGQEQALEKNLQGHRAALKNADREVERLTRERDQAREQG